MMIPVQFDLVSSRPCPWIESIRGSLAWFNSGLSCHYRITGDWNHLSWPALSSSPQRCMDLWQGSCCELFIGLPDKSSYLELNVSPSGDWNCFEFSEYRTGMRESTNYYPRDFIRRCEPGNLRSVEVTLGDIDRDHRGIPANSGNNPDIIDYIHAQSLQIGIAVIIRSLPDALQEGENDLYYYGLHRPEDKPDFHQRAGFRIKLETSQ